MSRCILCDELLHRAERQTCHGCLARAGELLSGVVTMWAELPQHRGHLRSARFGGGSSDIRIPGGDVLVLAGPGAYGGESRRLSRGEQQRPERWWLLGSHGPLPLRAYLAVERERTGREHQVDNRPTDTPSVAQVLTGWAADWSGDDRCRTVPAAAGYLARRTGWAARELDVFGEYVHDLEQLHARLERVTGRAVDIVRANVDCLACGRALVKQLDDVGRQEEDFTCEGCGRVVTEQRYHLALSAELRRRDRVVLGGVEFGTPVLVAAVLGRPVATVRAWERAGLIRRLDHDGVLLVAVDDAAREHEERATRTRRAS
ncbi:MAG: hypothetical protein JWM40_2967 [Frankiales bacterium]|nr:hypothetical protein [Frankiales bacterium]